MCALRGAPVAAVPRALAAARSQIAHALGRGSYMRGKRLVVIGGLVTALAGMSLGVGALVGTIGTPREDAASVKAAAAAARGAAKVQSAYAEWAGQHDANGGDRAVTISLGFWKALSSEF